MPEQRHEIFVFQTATGEEYVSIGPLTLADYEANDEHLIAVISLPEEVKYLDSMPMISVREAFDHFVDVGRALGDDRAVACIETVLGSFWKAARELSVSQSSANAET